MAELVNAPEIDLATVKNKAVKGVVALTGRTFILQAIGFLGSVVLLPAFLSPSEYGVFFLVSAVVNFLVYFSDIGLAAALIQKKEKLTPEDLRTTFTIQQLLVFLLVFIIFIITPFLKKWYGLSGEAVYLLWALAVSFVLTSLKTIPSVLLERELEFGKLIIPQIAETVIFNGVAVLLAWQGAGIISFTVAVLSRGLVGLILIYILQPWMPGFAFSKSSLTRLLRFGIPYQTNTFLAAVKDDGMIAFLGGILGASGIGFLSWAKKWAEAPLRFFMDQVIKVTFPAFSRMQEDKEELRHAVEKTLYFISLLIFPLLVGILILAQPLVAIIPRYSKWEVALLALYLFIINSAFGAVTTPLTNALTAVGKIKIVFKLMVMWTILTWIIYPILAVRYGVNGVAAGAAIVATSSVVAIWIAKRYLVFNFLKSIIQPTVASIMTGILIFILSPFLTKNILGIVSLVIVGGCIYFGLIYAMMGQQFIADVRKLFYALKSR